MQINSGVVAATPARRCVIPVFLIARIIAEKCIKATALRCISWLIEPKVPFSNLNSGHVHVKTKTKFQKGMFSDGCRSTQIHTFSSSLLQYNFIAGPNLLR